MGDRVLTEIPEALRKLIKYIMRGFYKIEEALLMDYLMAHPCIREDDLEELIKFDRKMLRQHLNVLKQELFIKARLRVETDANGRATRHNYYYIAYNTFINVVKYKLYNMRRKIEADERQSTQRASYICPNCKKTYTELDVGELMTPTCELHCSYCQTEVIEEKLETPTAGAKSMRVRFNEQFEPIYKLLQELEGINLSPEILEPQPKEPKAAKSSGAGGSRAAGGERWSGSASRNAGFNYVNEVTIAMEGKAGESGAAAIATKTKEAPVWMKESTIEGAKPDVSTPNFAPASAAAKDSFNRTDSDDIMRTLLSLESKPTGASVPRNESSDSENEAAEEPSSSQHSDDEPMELEDEDEETDWMVTIGGIRVPCMKVTNEMVEKMTQAEKDEYIRISREMYDSYDY